MNCIKCNSEEVRSLTDDDLRELHLLHWYCPTCSEQWVTGWDIDLPPRPETLEHIEKYKDKIMAYISKHTTVEERFEEIKGLLNEIFEVEWTPYSEWDSYRLVIFAEDKDKILANITQVLLKLKKIKNE